MLCKTKEKKRRREKNTHRIREKLVSKGMVPLRFFCTTIFLCTCWGVKRGSKICMIEKTNIKGSDWGKSNRAISILLFFLPLLLVTTRTAPTFWIKWRWNWASDQRIEFKLSFVCVFFPSQYCEVKCRKFILESLGNLNHLHHSINCTDFKSRCIYNLVSGLPRIMRLFSHTLLVANFSFRISEIVRIAVAVGLAENERTILHVYFSVADLDCCAKRERNCISYAPAVLYLQ